MSGKVVGVGGLALVQYIVVLIPSAAALIFQDRIAALVLGGSSNVALPEGISLGLLVVFGVMFVLGFALYAVLYAGAASLVSRQEDVNQIVAPLTIISVGGYLVASYAGTGLIPIDSPLVVVLSFIPFFSPYLMLTRMGQGTAGPAEIAHRDRAPGRCSSPSRCGSPPASTAPASSCTARARRRAHSGGPSAPAEAQARRGPAPARGPQPRLPAHFVTRGRLGQLRRPVTTRIRPPAPAERARFVLGSCSGRGPDRAVGPVGASPILS